MPTTEATHDYRSLGHLCSELQVSFRKIEKAATELGIAPAIRLNGIVYFDGEQTERLTQHFRESK